MQPNFLIIGATKSGTTALYRYLKQHPDVFMPDRKEPGFFVYWNHDREFRMHPPMTMSPVDTLEEYERLFEGVQGERAIGEGSVCYYWSQNACANIKQLIPEVKLIAVLRHPAERAYSHWVSHLRDGTEPLEEAGGFRQALAVEEERLASGWHPNYGYKLQGRYHEMLRPYFQAFGRDQIRIFLYEDLLEDALRVVREIYGFLGVDEGFTPDLTVQYNPSGIPRSPVLARSRFRSAIARVLRPVTSPDSRARIAAKIARWNLRRLPPLSAELRRELTAEFREDIVALQDLIGRDLSGWLEPTAG